MKNSTGRAYSADRTKRLAGMAVFTAIVIILQMLGSFIRFGPFSISLVLVPIVIGSALYGAGAGAWFGLVFGVMVVIFDAGSFLAINIPGTIVTCLSKGILAGLAAGAAYKLLEKKSTIAAAALAAVICPIVNTGVFLVGCYLFFLPTIAEWAGNAGFENVGRYMLFGLVGANFLFEMLVNVLLSPVIIRLIKIAKKTPGK